MLSTVLKGRCKLRKGDGAGSEGILLRQGCVCLCSVKLREAVTLSRNAVQFPLSAASMESYTRAYPHLVVLHMLKEVESGMDIITGHGKGENSVGPIERARLLAAEAWTSRLKLTQMQVNRKPPAVLKGA